MAYEWERDEHRRAVRAMDQWERSIAYAEARRSVGIAGDISDASNPLEVDTDA